MIMTNHPTSAHQAGAGSAINDTIREVGGSLGIAVLGSLAAAAYRSRLTDALAVRHAPGLVAHLATSSIAAGDLVGKAIGVSAGRELVGAAHSAFVGAMVTLAQRHCPAVDRSLWCLWRRLRAPSLSKPLSAGLCPTMADRYPTKKRSTDD